MMGMGMDGMGMMGVDGMGMMGMMGMGGMMGMDGMGMMGMGGMGMMGMMGMDGMGMGTYTPCINGLMDGRACCPASCVTCGGPGCGERPGGASACCNQMIVGEDRPCANSADTQCMVPGNPPYLDNGMGMGGMGMTGMDGMGMMGMMGMGGIGTMGMGGMGMMGMGMGMMGMDG